MRKSLPTRVMREHPDLDQLKRQAKELLEAFIAGQPDAVAEVIAHYHDADAATFALSQAQLVLARAYGFDSWPKLKAYVEGVTVKRFEDAVQAGDVVKVRAMLKARPELVASDCMRYAVFNRSSEMVRALMEHGASARAGVYPHRDATSPLTIAIERGYDDIVTAINQGEQRQREARSGVNAAPATDDLFQAITSGDDDRAVAMMEANPALIRSCNLDGWTPLHVASQRLNERIVAWLLDHDADVLRQSRNGWTALDAAAHWPWYESAERFAAVAALLRERGAVLTAPAAVALGDADWLRARRAEGALINHIEDLRPAQDRGEPQPAGDPRVAPGLRVRPERADTLRSRGRGRRSVHLGHATVSLRGIR